MCGRIVCLYDPQVAMQLFGARAFLNQAHYRSGYNIGPTRKIPAAFKTKRSKLSQKEKNLLSQDKQETKRKKKKEENIQDLTDLLSESSLGHMSVEGKQIQNSSEEESSFEITSKEEEKEEYKMKEEEEVLMDAMHWGFHEPNMFLLNGRFENLSQTKSFKGLVDSQRCVVRNEENQVPINGYFEWQERANLQKVPYFIHLSDQEQPMFLAGLYKEIQDEQTGDIQRYCVLLTTASIGPIAGIHHRMPVILTDHTKEFWLDSSHTFKECVAVIVNTPLSELDFYQVPHLVNSVRNQGEDIILPVQEYKEKKKKAFFSMYQKKDEEIPVVRPSQSKQAGAGESFALQRRKESNRKEKNKQREKKSDSGQKLMTSFFKKNN